MKTLTVQTREAIHQSATLILSITRIQSKSLNSFILKSIKHDRSSRSSNQIQEAHGSHSSLAPNSNLPKSLTAGLTKNQVNTLIQLMQRCIDGKDSFNICDYDHLRTIWDAYCSNWLRKTPWIRQPLFHTLESSLGQKCFWFLNQVHMEDDWKCIWHFFV